MRSKFWKLPPKIKILEALGAIADGRVRINGNRAKVLSSRGEKEYEVIYDPSKNAIISNDNGSMFKGYLGYPAIAFLMLKGKLSFDEKYAVLLKNILWKDLNEKYKSYTRVLEVIRKVVKERGGDFEKIDGFAEEVLQEIKMKKFKKLEVPKTQKTLSDF